ncbi:hypothetical protein [Flavisolibacter tropicus]|uniref:DUF2231 domain-containing protein n=1 Tax=Flavisolibacter tropicus TaxID=1492898 RepID=A0A172TUJ6_9BACT|nr:hypothetical protein [Flavisolibacter tropicus]ANE50791.1 hypothetical protein SY85_10040 [Flavisolibacter tropicus]
MNSAQIHLALTHVPVILSLVGLVLLAIAMYQKNNTLIQTAFWILLIGGLIAIPVYQTGEGAEEIVERLPGVSKSIIEAHEEMGMWALVAASTAGLLAFLGLAFPIKMAIGRLMPPLVLLATLVSAGVLVYTAHLGGQVRHTELRSGFTPAAASDSTHETRNDDN